MRRFSVPLWSLPRTQDCQHSKHMIIARHLSLITQHTSGYNDVADFLYFYVTAFWSKLWISYRQF